MSKTKNHINIPLKMKTIDNKYSFGFLQKTVSQLVLDIGMKRECSQNVETQK